jgi:hypothetical protein
LRPICGRAEIWIANHSIRGNLRSEQSGFKRVKHLFELLRAAEQYRATPVLMSSRPSTTDTFAASSDGIHRDCVRLAARHIALS